MWLPDDPERSISTAETTTDASDRAHTRHNTNTTRITGAPAPSKGTEPPETEPTS